MTAERCKFCKYYTAYYKQGIDGYRPLGFGFCAQKNRGQTATDCCDGFKSDSQREISRNQSRMRCLERAIESLNIIAGIFAQQTEECL